MGESPAGQAGYEGAMIAEEGGSGGSTIERHKCSACGVVWTGDSPTCPGCGSR